jgi:hypothetical protein
MADKIVASYQIKAHLHRDDEVVITGEPLDNPTVEEVLDVVLEALTEYPAGEGERWTGSAELV